LSVILVSPPVIFPAFCLPLDFVSQAVVTAVFFSIHFPANCPQVAYVFQLLLEHAPPLLLLQQGLESSLHVMLQLLQPLVLIQPAAAAAIGSIALDPSDNSLTAAAAGGDCRDSCPSGTASATSIAVGSMLFDAPRAAPDLHTVAGRWIFVCSTAYMLFAVLLVPLYVSWRLERHLKSKWMATLPDVQLQQVLLLQQQQQVAQERGQQQQQQQAQEREQEQQDAAACAAGDHTAGESAGSSSKAAADAGSPATDSCNDTSGACSSSATQQQQQQQQQQSRSAWRLLLPQWRLSSSSSKGADRFVYPPVVFDVLPDAHSLLRHLAVLLAISVVAAQVFVQMCRLAPHLVQRVMWPQIVFK
jgi:hypothetical protein